MFAGQVGDCLVALKTEPDVDFRQGEVRPFDFLPDDRLLALVSDAGQNGGLVGIDCQRPELQFMEPVVGVLGKLRLIRTDCVQNQ